MRATNVLVALTLMTAVVSAAPDGAALADCRSRGRRCSTPPTRPASKAVSEGPLRGARRLRPGERIVVPVVYHLIYGSEYGSNTRRTPGFEPDDLEHAPPLALVHLQTTVLNRAFAGTAFSFVTAHAEQRSFAPWRTRPGSALRQELVEMIRDLNAERRDALHVFLLRQDDIRAAPPDTKRMFDDVRRRTDGVLMYWDYLPYVPALRPNVDGLVRESYFEGETLVHQVGHYLGLLHTFEPWPGADIETEDGVECGAQCAQISDLVRDTPVHRAFGAGCDPIDTCPEYPGLDPIANYMSASSDRCTSQFTAGQVERMERMVRAFRPHLIVAAPASPP